MGDCDDSASGSELFERLLNLLFRFGIERRCCFVEQKNRRVFQDGARNRETLLLSAGEKTSFVTDDCFVAVRLRHDEIMRECGVPVLPGSLGVLKTPEEALAVAGEIGYPVALKLHSHTITHKTDVGGVQ